MDIQELIAKVRTVSQKYAKTNDITRDDDWYMLKLQEEVGELTQQYLLFTGRSRKISGSPSKYKEQFEDELVDVLGHILLIADRYNIDLDNAFKRKWFRQLE